MVAKKKTVRKIRRAKGKWDVPIKLVTGRMTNPDGSRRSTLPTTAELRAMNKQVFTPDKRLVDPNKPYEPPMRFEKRLESAWRKKKVTKRKTARKTTIKRKVSRK